MFANWPGDADAGRTREHRNPRARSAENITTGIHPVTSSMRLDLPTFEDPLNQPLGHGGRGVRLAIKGKGKAVSVYRVTLGTYRGM